MKRLGSENSFSFKLERAGKINLQIKLLTYQYPTVILYHIFSEREFFD